MNSVWENAFKISTNGRNATPTFAIIKNLESVEMSIDGTVQEWFAMDAEGFARNLITAKKISFGCSAKRTDGDAGNDYVAGMMLAIGAAAQSEFELTFANGDKLTGDCTINFTKGLGASEDVDPMEFDVLLDGKPTFTAGV